MEGIMLVYLVTDGDYSDYHVLGVFSTMDRAARYKELYNAENDIAVFALDPAHPPVIAEGMLPWSVVICKDGTVSQLDRRSVRYAPTRARWMPVRLWTMDEYGLIVFCWARDAAHAVKIAGDIRTQVLAHQSWPTKHVEVYTEYQPNDELDREEP
jgi:hypothetical protein